MTNNKVGGRLTDKYRKGNKEVRKTAQGDSIGILLLKLGSSCSLVTGDHSALVVAGHSLVKRFQQGF